ncbi:hypothetical protein CCAX7_009510 [Capsulimonas corticalis]|uniref:Uncharacterized protein n=1 Tax=Capsulimonas corticalis TaxID=2219043 RepID=A0A402CU99_9BACT|nr:hypothetical protein [Capsulimonas corticalis]BDI28900.1 hypothetical protein CCAX7_009510 [Capsulimonas corticalis]
MIRKASTYSKPLAQATLVMSLSLLGTGMQSAHAARVSHSVPPASFINYHVDTVQQLSQQVELDPAVRARLARHFHMTGPQLVSYINHHLKLKRLSAAKKYRVYCVDRNGREFFIMTRLPAGTPVFVSKSTGQPILKLACGNPMVSVLPHADMESNAGPGALSGKKKQLAADLAPSPFDTLNGHNPHSEDSDITSPAPGDVMVTKNIPDVPGADYFTPPPSPVHIPPIHGGFSPLWFVPIIGGLASNHGGSSTGGTTTGTTTGSTNTTTGSTTGVTTTGGTTTGGTTTGGTTTGGTTTGGTTTGGTTTGGTTTGGSTTGTTTGGTTTGGTTTGTTTGETTGTTTGVTTSDTTGTTTGNTIGTSTTGNTTGNTPVPETGSGPAVAIGAFLLAAQFLIRRRRLS